MKNKKTRAQRKKASAKKVLTSSGNDAQSTTDTPNDIQETVRVQRLSWPCSKLTGAGTALPADYAEYLSKYQYKELTGDEPPPKESFRYTTLPKVEDGCGVSEWLVRGSKTLTKVLNTPGHPSPVPLPQRKMIAIKPTPDMGFGVFALCDIKEGELIHAERPLVVAPHGWRLKAPDHYTMEQALQLSMRECEELFQIMIDRLEPMQKACFYYSANSHTEDGSGPIVGIIRTNSFALDSLSVENEVYGGFGPIGSKFNHSCVSNMRYKFDIPSFSMQFYAKGNIKAGEQIFYNYCGDVSVVAERRAYLARYGIDCRCPLCVVEAALAQMKLS